MHVLDIEQGSLPWKEIRRNKITATDCAGILGKSRYKSPRMIWEQKLNQTEVVPNDAMRRGTLLEPEARAFYNEKLGCNFRPIVALSEERPWQMASLDGWDEKHKSILEIKCPGEKAFLAAQEGDHSPDYIYQCLHQMAVNDQAEAAVLFYYFIDALGSIKTVSLVIDRDKASIIDLNEKEEAFYRSCMLRYIEPEHGPLDFRQRKDSEWANLCDAWKVINQEITHREDARDLLRKKIIESASGQSCRGAGIQLTKYKREGSVDYKKIPELQGIDLSSYRKPGIESWRISEVEELGE